MNEDKKVCPGCGLEVPSYVKYCAECGSFIPDKDSETNEEIADFIVDDTANTSDNNTYNTAYNPYNTSYTPPTDRVMTKQEYFKWKGDLSVTRSINLAAILCFVLAGLCLPSMIILLTSSEPIYGFALFFDIAVYVGLGLGAMLKQSKGCLLAASIYYGIGLLLVFTSIPLVTIITRIIFTAILINGFIKANQFDKDYKYYLWQKNEENK